MNEEGSADLAISLATKALSDTADRWNRDNKKKAEQLLEAAEYICNLLEAGQYVPMHIPPTARVEAYRAQENPNVEEIRAWVYELIGQLRDACCMVGQGATNNRA